MDDEASYGEVPGTDAYNLRAEDAKPDEIAVIPDVESNQSSITTRRPSTPGDRPIPITVVEKVDPTSPSHGEVPGTAAHERRKSDAVPDVVLATENHHELSKSPRSRAGSTPGDLPIPTTKVEKVDSTPSHGEVPGTEAYEVRGGDAEPDVVEIVGDTSGKKSHSSLGGSASD